MNEDNFKIILEEALDPIKKQLNDFAPMKGDLNLIKQRLDDPKTGLNRINEKLDALWDQTVKLTEEAEETKEFLKSQSRNLNKTNDNVVKVDKRLTKVENHLGVSSPPELSII